MTAGENTFVTGALRRAFERADLVSFDVFDTLVTRPLLRANAVFELVGERAIALLSSYRSTIEAAGGFRILREQAGKAAMELAHQRAREEYELLAAYEWLCAQIAAPSTLASQLMKLEEETELALHAPRAAGRELFELAHRLNKRVVLISDMYLTPHAVGAILTRCGYREQAALYVSSEHGVLKRTGKLYERIAELEGRPKRWVHVGDNRLADVRAPTALGIRSFHLANASDKYLQQRSPELRPREQLGNTLGSSLLHGVISRRLYDSPKPARSRYDGSAYRLGYEGGGPLLLAFTQWVLDKARRDGLTDVCFLARDGFVPKQLYELLTAEDPNAPRAHYVYASRRALSVAALRSEADIVASLQRMSKASVEHVLRHRFGVVPERLLAGTLEQAGLTLEQRVDLSKANERRKLEQLLRANAPVILAQAESERADMLAYLESLGVHERERRIAVVDIGHNASLQVALSRLLGRDDLAGYYFATFEPARAVYERGFDISSYLLEFEDSVRSDHVYCANVGLFEFLFLPAFPSLERVRRAADGTFEPIYVVGDESKRFAVVAQAHRGVLDFARDVIAACAGDAHLFRISKNEALSSFAKFTQKPDRADALLFANVSFVDAFAGNTRRFLIAPSLLSPSKGAKLSDYQAQSWWTQGADAVHGNPLLRKMGGGEASGALGRKLRKLVRDPGQFMADMKVFRRLRSK